MAAVLGFSPSDSGARKTLRSFGAEVAAPKKPFAEGGADVFLIAVAGVISLPAIFVLMVVAGVDAFLAIFSSLAGKSDREVSTLR